MNDVQKAESQSVQQEPFIDIPMDAGNPFGPWLRIYGKKAESTINESGLTIWQWCGVLMIPLALIGFIFALAISAPSQ